MNATEIPQAETVDAKQTAGGLTSAPFLVAGAMFGNLVSVNTVLTFTIGIFISAFHASYGWTRADIALSMTCFTIVAFVGSSLIGKAADRYSPRLIAVVSLLAFGTGLMLVPLIVTSVHTLWAAYLLLAIVGLGTSPVVMNRPLITSFSRRRGLAIALALTGSGIGGFLLPQWTAAFVAQGGWRLGFTGLGWLAVAASPVVWLLLGRQADAREGSAASGQPCRSDPSFRAAFGTRLFWILSVIAFCGGLGMSGPAAHLVPLLGDEGVSPLAAARFASIIGVASVVGRLLTGVVLDRFDTPASGAPLMAVGVVGLLLLGQANVHAAPYAIALLGFVIGSEVAILSYYISRYFELSAHATIFGWVYGAMAFGSAIGPVLVGALRDWQGNYGLGFTLSAFALGTASLLCLFLGQYRNTLRHAPKPG